MEQRNDPTRSWWYRLTYGTSIGCLLLSAVLGVAGVVLLAIGVWIVFSG